MARSGSRDAVLAVAAVIGLAIMGDSLMYGLLPLEAPHLGIAPPLVGVLLSVNRLVRLVSNALVGTVFARVGPRRPFFLATVLALMTTLAYGWAPGVAVFLLARAGWGIAWSALRQGGFQSVWGGEERERGGLMGLLWGTIRLGSAIAVLVGGMLYDRYGYRVAVLGIALMTAIAIPVAWRLHWPKEAAQRLKHLGGWRDSLRVFSYPPVRWAILAGGVQALFEATLVSTAALFLADWVGKEVTIAFLGTATGILLAVRWLGDLVFGPLFGTLSDRVGRGRTALALAGGSVVLSLGPVRAPAWLAMGGLALLFLCSAGLVVVLSTTANSLAVRTSIPHLVVGMYATAVDTGLAVGPLLAYSVGLHLTLVNMYLILALLLLVVVLRSVRTLPE